MDRLQASEAMLHDIQEQCGREKKSCIRQLKPYNGPETYPRGFPPAESRPRLNPQAGKSIREYVWTHLLLSESAQSAAPCLT